MSRDNVMANSTLVNILPSPTAARTATALGSAIDMLGYEGNAVFVLDSAEATAGTNPTLDVKLQHCDTSGGSYTDITGAVFTQVTATASRQKLVVDLGKVKRYVKESHTIGGTNSPSFVHSLNMVAMKKYVG